MKDKHTHRVKSSNVYILMDIVICSSYISFTFLDEVVTS
jgi:hypothetical protein